MKSTTRVCDTCHEAAPLQAFQKMGRGYRTTCEACRAAPAEPAPEPAQEPDPITMAPGFGFNAGIENGNLVVRQLDTEGNTDTVVLSRTEAKVLFAQFQPWVNA
jgi:hypothetical protein